MAMKDLHQKKASHLTVALQKGIEVHLEKKDFNGIKHKVGQKMNLVVPSVTTSVDAGHVRFKQTKKLKPMLPKEHLKRVVKKMLKNKEN